MRALYVVGHDSRMPGSRSAAAESLRIADFRSWLRAADRAPGTVELRAYHVLRYARDVTRPLEASTDTIISWLSLQSWSTETRRAYRASLRTYYAWAHMVGLVDQDPARALPPIRPLPSLPRPAAEDQLERALRTADDRVRLMIMLGAMAGLRRAEIAQVHTRDLQPDLGGWSLRVRGKGRRDRLVPLTAELATALRRAPAGWVFPSPAGGHLTPAHVGKLVARQLGDGTTSHQLRHRFATRAYAVDHDLLVVQQLLGHAKPETTMIYTKIPSAAKRRTVDQLAS